jgi:hypothetical protein
MKDTSGCTAQLALVTHTSTPPPKEGDTMILLGPAPRICNAVAVGRC